jgi:hypothetical protein
MEAPLRPGPKERVGYVADIRLLGGNPHLTVMSLYTTTAPWPSGAVLPLGVVRVEAAMARAMNQKTFVLDARRIAFIPADLTFFPRLAQPDRGVVFKTSFRFQERVEDILLQLADRAETVVQLGPDVPGARRR